MMESGEKSESPLLLTVNFPAPHGPEDAAQQYQTIFNSTSNPLNQNYNYVKNDKKHRLLRHLMKLLWTVVDYTVEFFH